MGRFANHIDYQKWNNHQRKESTSAVFTGICKSFGLPNLFASTHEFFEKSWIYYRDRPDLLAINRDNGIYNNIVVMAAWNGPGNWFGQKVWSVLNLLAILNTQVKILPQGDNQVIYTQHHLNTHRTELTIGRYSRSIVNCK